MANKNFVVQNGLQVGPLTIDALTGSITTTGNLQVSGFQANITQDIITSNAIATVGLSVSGNLTTTNLNVTNTVYGNAISYSNFSTVNKARLLANSIIFGI
jgi:hypothetical protein